MLTIQPIEHYVLRLKKLLLIDQLLVDKNHIDECSHLRQEKLVRFYKQMLEDICFNDIEQEILKEILALQIKVS